MRATIVDIRKRTGLSLATISKYLNGGNVRPENKEKIDEAIEALHYRVNETARSLVTRNTRTIGVVVYSIENLYTGIMLRHIGDYFRELGYGMLICDSNNDTATEQQNLHSMLQKNVDGIILMPVSRDAGILSPLIEAGVPVVCLDRRLDDDCCDSVSINNRQAIRSLIRILADNGHRDIAFLGSSQEYTGYQRLMGFREAMKESHLPIAPGREYLDALSLTAGYHGMKTLLSYTRRPTAVLMSNYEITLGAVMALHESSCSYPEDVSILGMDDLLLSDVVLPRITVAVQPMKEMAQAASGLLYARIRGESDPAEPARSLVYTATVQEYDSVKKIG